MNAFGYVAGAALTAVSWTAAAQVRPDLSGTWVLDREKTAALAGSQSGVPAGGAVTGGGRVGTGGASGGGAMMSAGTLPEWTMVVSTATVTAERPAAMGGQKYVYKLDGSESTNVNVRTTLTTKTRWDAGRLVTEGTQSTKTDQGDVVVKFREVRWLDREGAMLIQTTRQMEPNPPTTVTQVYVKKKS
jgi:hypothetical protein